MIYEELKEKYEDLIFYISYRITGDIALASFEDNVQDLWIAVMNAVEGFSKKINKSYTEFKDDKLWDSYIKTVLWNHKNKKGKAISKRYKIHRDILSLNNNKEDFNGEQICELVNEKYNTEESYYISELCNLLPKIHVKAIKVILEDPSLLYPSGKINIVAFSKALNVSRYIGQKIVDELTVAMEQDIK